MNDPVHLLWARGYRSQARRDGEVEGSSVEVKTVLESEPTIEGLEIRSEQEVVKLTEAVKSQASLRESHEKLAQLLYSIMLAASASTSAGGQALLPKDEERLPQLLTFIREQSEAALEELRRLVSESLDSRA